MDELFRRVLADPADLGDFGDSIPAYREVSAYSRLYSESRELVVPDGSKLGKAKLRGVEAWHSLLRCCSSGHGTPS